MELKEPPVKIVGITTEVQSQRIVISLEMEKVPESNRTITALHTCVTDAIMKWIKENPSVKKKSVNYGNLPIEKLWDICLNRKLSNETRMKAQEEIGKRTDIRR